MADVRESQFSSRAHNLSALCAPSTGGHMPGGDAALTTSLYVNYYPILQMEKTEASYVKPPKQDSEWEAPLHNPLTNPKNYWGMRS